MATHTFDVAAFRAQFPQFEPKDKYPDEMLSGYFDMATCFIPPDDNWCGLHGNCLQLALNLMTAHLTLLGTQNNAGQGTAGVVTSSTIDRVSVATTIPQTRSAWQFFLAKTPYGLQLWAMLQAKAIGGWYIGGSNERRGFRKAGGGF